MNEQTTKNIQNFIPLFSVLCILIGCLLIVRGSIPDCNVRFSIETLKENVVYGFSRIQNVFLPADKGTEENNVSGVHVDSNPEFKSLSGAAEEERVLFAVRNPEFIAYLSEREMLIYDVVSSFAERNMNKSNLEIALAANDYICENTTYAHEFLEHLNPYDNSQCAYSSLVLEKSVCSGYSHAYNLLCNAASETINAMYVVGYVEDSRHAWSIVQLDDGVFYHVDTTWNDDTTNDDGWDYEYAFKSDDYMRQSRTWEENDYPICPVSLVVKE